jgi:hypothetical protein
LAQRHILQQIPRARLTFFDQPIQAIGITLFNLDHPGPQFCQSADQFARLFVAYSGGITLLAAGANNGW